MTVEVRKPSLDTTPPVLILRHQAYEDFPHGHAAVVPAKKLHPLGFQALDVTRLIACRYSTGSVDEPQVDPLDIAEVSQVFGFLSTPAYLTGSHCKQTHQTRLKADCWDSKFGGCLN